MNHIITAITAIGVFVGGAALAEPPLPTCGQEDCSDQPGQIGVWTDPDTGNRWLSTGETSQEVGK